MKRIVIASSLIAALALLGASANSHAGQKTGGVGTMGCVPGGLGTGQITYRPNYLWPPDHKMQTINISYSFSDSSHKNSCYELTVTNIHDNQSNPNGSGEQGGSGKPTGKQGLDWSGIGNSVSGSNPGTIALSVQVRAERAGTNMNARDYDITVECAQFQCGNPSNLIAGPDQGDLHVIVPHDQGH